jgi:hypothetical protein
MCTGPPRCANASKPANANGCSCRASRPDFNPIEEAFSKLKSYLRRVKARTRERLESAIAEGLQRIRAQDARNWFAHCGFALGSQ